MTEEPSLPSVGCASWGASIGEQSDIYSPSASPRLVGSDSSWQRNHSPQDSQTSSSCALGHQGQLRPQTPPAPTGRWWCGSGQGAGQYGCQ